MEDDLEKAKAELEEASKRLERHWITEQDIVRRNRAERIVRELEKKANPPSLER